MKPLQRTLTATVAAAALLGSFAFSSNAQTASPSSPVAEATHSKPAHAHRADKKDIAKSNAERTERLKNLLQLQPSQQAAFDKYVKAITPESRDKAKADRPDLSKLSTPERLDLAQKLRKERTAQAEQREAATRSFYSSLNSSQQKAFDEHAPRGPGQHKQGHSKHADHPRGHAPAASKAPAA